MSETELQRHVVDLRLALQQTLEEMQRLHAELAACIAHVEHAERARSHDQTLIAKLTEELEVLRAREKSYVNAITGGPPPAAAFAQQLRVVTQHEPVGQGQGAGDTGSVSARKLDAG